MKHEASLLKDLKVDKNLDTVVISEPSLLMSLEFGEENPAPVEDLSKNEDCFSHDHDVEETLEAVHSSSAQAGSTADLPSTAGRQCRFGTTSWGTIPATPVSGHASVTSPPGLSRKAMRQARDACMAGTATAIDWVTCAAPVLTINSSGKPMTPPAVRAAKRSVLGAQEGYPQNSSQDANSVAPR